MSDRRIILDNGPGPTVVIIIEPAFVAKRRHLFTNLDTAFEFAQFLSEVTDWPIIDQVDSVAVDQPRRAS